MGFDSSTTNSTRPGVASYHDQRRAMHDNNPGPHTRTRPLQPDPGPALEESVSIRERREWSQDLGLDEDGDAMGAYQASKRPGVT